MKKIIPLLLIGFFSFSSKAAASLSGSWVGYFSYKEDHSRATEAFSAVIIQNGVALSGTILETVKDKNNKQVAVTSTLTGMISGNFVLFTKQYNGGAGRTHQVTYELSLESSNGVDLLAGVWKIDGKTGGKAGLAKLIPIGLRRQIETSTNH